MLLLFRRPRLNIPHLLPLRRELLEFPAELAVLQEHPQLRFVFLSVEGVLVRITGLQADRDEFKCSFLGVYRWVFYALVANLREDVHDDFS